MSKAGSFTKVLLVYVEPTPYILDFIEQVADVWSGGVDVVFLGENLSQPWNLGPGNRSWEVLPTSYLAAAKRLSHLVRNGRYAVVHLAGWGSPLLLMAMILSRALGLPVSIESDTPLSARQSWARRMLKRVLYPVMLGIPSIFLPGGTRQKRYLQHYGVPDSRIVVAHMTVDVAEIAAQVEAISTDVRRELRHAIGAPGDQCVFLFVGRLEPAKGVAVLLEAYAQLAAGRDGVRLLVVGDGTLSEQARAMESSGVGAKWMGRLEGSALLEAYAVADVLVLPSVFEPWGLVVNEAMAAGLPVIASSCVGCVDDLVIDGQTGIVVEADNVPALVRSMTRLADDASNRRAMGAAARHRIAGWTIQAEAEIVAGAWHRVLRS